MAPAEIGRRIAKRYERLDGCVGSDFQKRCKSLMELLQKFQESLAIVKILDAILENDEIVKPCLLDSTKASRQLKTAQFAAVSLHHLRQVSANAGHASKALQPEQGARGSAFESFRRRFLEPLVEYFEDELTTGIQILPALLKYKRLVEWTANELSAAMKSEKPESLKESFLEDHLYRFLMTEGLWFTPKQLQLKNGRADLALYNGSIPIPVEVKPFDNSRRGRNSIKQGFNQALDYAENVQSPVGYLVVFNLRSEGRLKFGELVKTEAPFFDYGSKRIFVVPVQVADIASPSQRQPEDFFFSREDLIPEGKTT